MCFGDREEVRQDESKGRVPVWGPSWQSKQAAGGPGLRPTVILPPPLPYRAAQSGKVLAKSVSGLPCRADTGQVFQGPGQEVMVVTAARLRSLGCNPPPHQPKRLGGGTAPGGDIFPVSTSRTARVLTK